MEENKIYFVVAVIDKVLDRSNIVIEKYFKVFELTKGKMYFEVADENDLAEYQSPILVSAEKEAWVLDSIEEALKQLEWYRTQVEQPGKEKLKETMESEIARLKNKYNIT